MSNINIVFGSTTGNTEDAVNTLSQCLKGNNVTLINIADAKEDDFTSPDLVIIGCSTWGMGDHQDDWESYQSDISNLNLDGKKMAFLGLGDQESYPDTFVDSMGMLYESFKERGICLIGKYSTEGYSYDSSKAEIADNKFVGLVLDQENQSDLTDDRLKEWSKQLLKELNE